MNSNDLDTYLELYNANGTRIAYDDDGGPGYNSLISDFSIPATGTYTIYARSYQDRGSGAYSLSLSALVVSGSMTYGQTVNDSIPVGGTDIWTFTTTGRDRVTINMTSSSFDTYLELYDASGNRLTSDDDGGSGTNSRINRYRVPSAGTYFIRARSYNNQGGGSYTLTLSN